MNGQFFCGKDFPDQVTQYAPSCWPEHPGVYAVILSTNYYKKQRLIYIGSSRNLPSRTRGNRHPIISRLAKRIESKSNRIVSVVCKECKDYQDEERKLIAKYKPLLNKNGIPGKMHVIRPEDRGRRPTLTPEGPAKTYAIRVPESVHDALTKAGPKRVREILDDGLRGSR